MKQGPRVTQLIQVCANVEDPRTRKRETRAFLKASEELKCGDLVVVTGSAEYEEDASWHGMKGTVRFMPLWKWLSG